MWCQSVKEILDFLGCLINKFSASSLFESKALTVAAINVGNSSGSKRKAWKVVQTLLFLGKSKFR